MNYPKLLENSIGSMNNLSDITKFEIEKVGHEYMKYLQDEFNKECGQINNTTYTWKKKSENTKKYYKKKGWNTIITGVRTGEMKRNFKYNFKNTNSKYLLSFENTVDYAKYFNEKRPMIYQNDKKLNELINIAKTNIFKKWQI